MLRWPAVQTNHHQTSPQASAVMSSGEVRWWLVCRASHLSVCPIGGLVLGFLPREDWMLSCHLNFGFQQYYLHHILLKHLNVGYIFKIQIFVRPPDPSYQQENEGEEGRHPPSFRCGWLMFKFTLKVEIIRFFYSQLFRINWLDLTHGKKEKKKDTVTVSLYANH